MSITILKIGGSVITHKSAGQPSWRARVIDRIAEEIKSGYRGKTKLIIVHGVGSFGHSLVRKYKISLNRPDQALQDRVALKIILSCQLLNNQVISSFNKRKVPVLTLPTHLLVKQKDGLISEFDDHLLTLSISQNCWPVIYGSMVPDSTLGWSVCSGDALISYICKKYPVKRVLFASDVDGLYNDDPFVNKNAVFFPKIKISQLSKLKIKKSHHPDVSQGMLGKVNSVVSHGKLLASEVIIFNGLKINNTRKALAGSQMVCTKIKRG